MATLFFMTLFILLLFQYAVVAALLIHEDESIETKWELFLYLFPIIVVLIFVCAFIYAMIFEKKSKADMFATIKRILKNADK
jgi:heme/copper-type cytochrome/quinol oxidase subunit 4